jgi:hypothetical protein
MDPEQNRKLEELERQLEGLTKAQVFFCKFPHNPDPQDLVAVARRRFTAELMSLQLTILRQILSIIPPDDEIRRQKFKSIVARVEFSKDQQDAGLPPGDSTSPPLE